MARRVHSGEQLARNRCHGVVLLARNVLEADLSLVERLQRSRIILRILHDKIIYTSSDQHRAIWGLCVSRN